MPRLACPEEPRTALHVVQRGRARLACFSCAGDRAVYLRALRACAEREQCAVHAYALMGNHIHLLFTPAHTAGAARLMPAIAACYARHLATAYDHEDSVWEEAYDASPVHARRHLLACMRYIEIVAPRAVRMLSPINGGSQRLGSSPGRGASFIQRMYRGRQQKGHLKGAALCSVY
jgi:putative transposase